MLRCEKPNLNKCHSVTTNTARRKWLAVVSFCVFLLFQFHPAEAAEDPSAQVNVSLAEKLGPMQIDHFALGQGGLSEEPMWDNRLAEIRAIAPAIIRLFVQEYFDLLAKDGRYHFEKLDQSVDTIVKAGAKPLMCLCFKPRPLFPKINQDIVEPNDYKRWDELIQRLVEHYKKRNGGGWFWEVANEPDIGEDGGC